jgi:hypothetical protein
VALSVIADEGMDADGLQQAATYADRLSKCYGSVPSPGTVNEENLLLSLNKHVAGSVCTRPGMGPGGVCLNSGFDKSIQCLVKCGESTLSVPAHHGWCW